MEVKPVEQWTDRWTGSNWFHTQAAGCRPDCSPKGPSTRDSLGKIGEYVPLDVLSLGTGRMAPGGRAMLV